MSESLDHLAARLRRAKTPDRRLDSEVTALAIGLPQARLDDLAGIDGWDIVLPSRPRSPRRSLAGGGVRRLGVECGEDRRRPRPPDPGGAHLRACGSHAAFVPRRLTVMIFKQRTRPCRL